MCDKIAAGVNKVATKASLTTVCVGVCVCVCVCVTPAYVARQSQPHARTHGVGIIAASKLRSGRPSAAVHVATRMRINKLGVSCTAGEYRKNAESSTTMRQYCAAGGVREMLN